MAGKSSLEVGNYACVVNCIGSGDYDTLSSLLTELTGASVSVCSGQSPLKWHVDNKYYSANIELFVCASPDQDAWECGGGFLGRDRIYQAVIFLCQLDKAESVDALQLLWTRIKSQSQQGEPPGGDFPIPDVRVVMGVANGAHSDDEIMQWCVREGIELIRWERDEECSEPQTQDCDSDDGLPPEAEGVARLAETLQAHMWPTITMKGRDPTTLETQPIPTSDGSRSTEQVSEISKDSSTSMDGKNASTVTGSLEELESKAATPGNKEEYQKRVDSLLAAADQEHQKEEQDPGGENFENLFSRFADMKQHAESLPHEERKAYAEKVVMAFWNSIGGDEEELSDNA